MNEEKRVSAGAVLLALLKAGCYLLLFLGAQLLVSFVFAVVAVISSVLGGGADPDLLTEQLLSQTGAISLISAVLTLVVAVVFFLIRRKNPLYEVGLVRADLSLVGAAAVLTPALYLAVSLLMMLVPQSLLDQYAEASASLSDVSLVAFLATVIGAPLVEEIIFRGLIQSRLERVMPGWLAGVIAALIFGVCHGQIVWVIYAFLMGFLFGRMRLTSRSILPGLAAHFVFNLVGFLMTALEPVLSDEAMVGGLFALAIAGLIIARRQIPRLFGFGKNRNSD